MKTWFRIAIVGAIALGLGGCSNEITSSSAPVELVSHVLTQPIARVDLAGLSGDACKGNVATFQIENRIKRSFTGQNTSFLDVRLTRYSITYTRTDGGKLVPAPYSRSLNVLVAAGASNSEITLHLLDFGDAFNQAPFVSLLPVNGGRDPDTGSNRVKLNMNVTVFGETLAGDAVSTSFTIPLDVCYNCGGCSQ